MVAGKLLTVLILAVGITASVIAYQYLDDTSGHPSEVLTSSMPRVSPDYKQKTAQTEQIEPFQDIKLAAAASKSLSHTELPSKKLKPLNLWSASPKELSAIYRRGILEGATSVEKLSAKLALDFCLASARNLMQPQPKGSNPLLVYEMQDAAQKLRERCAEFQSMDIKDLIQSHSTLNVSLNGPESPLSERRNTLPRSPSPQAIENFKSSLTSTLRSHGEEALLWAGPAISEWIVYEMSETTATNSSLAQFAGADVWRAVALSGCFVGLDCSAQSLAYLANCTYGAQCGGSYQTAVLDGLTDEATISKTTALAHHVASATQRRNLQSLGLDGAGTSRKQ